MLTLTSERWAQLQAVQADINARVGYRADLDLYGRAEVWAVADRAGDCEDYALAKRAALLALGWPVAALRLATCQTEHGEPHAVLTLDTDRGAYVLDNRHGLVMAWADLPYRWLQRQAAGGRAWASIAA